MYDKIDVAGYTQVFPFTTSNITNFEMENYNMATTRKTQIEKVESLLRKYNTGITASKLASLARIPRESVSKRVYDLRETYKILTSYRTVNGKRTAFYRFAN